MSWLPFRGAGPQDQDFSVPSSRIGRGGSVSRRDLNYLAGTRAQLAGAHKLERKRTSNPSHSSGGSAREALLLEKRPPSQYPPRPLFIFFFLRRL